MPPSRIHEQPICSLDHFPALDDIEPGELRISFGYRAFSGTMPFKDAPPRDAWLFNLVRLAEKAVEDYNAARQHFEDFAEQRAGITQALMGCINALEDCVNAVHRGFLFVERFRTVKPSISGAPVFDDDWKLRLKSVEYLVKRVNAVRNAIEHRDNDLPPDRERPEGDSAFLAPQNEHAYIEAERIAYADLARLVRTLHAVACSLAPLDVQ